MIRHLHGYEIHGHNKGPFVIRQGVRIFATFFKLRDALDAVRALARGDTPVICVYRERDPAGRPVYERDKGMATLGSLIRAKLEIDDAIERLIRTVWQ